jgi:hypothetical protein
MARPVSLTLVVFAALVPLALMCGGEKPPPKVAQEAADESWVTDGGAQKKAAPKTEKPTGSSGPELKLRDASMIEAQVDYTGAVLIIAEKAKLTFPEDAIDKGTAVHFGFAQSKQQGPSKIGSVYEFAPGVSSAGPPLVLELPLPKGRKSANFALSRYETQNGQEKVVWDIKPATRIDEENGIAVIELTEIGEGWIHLTSKAP